MKKLISAFIIVLVSLSAAVYFYFKNNKIKFSDERIKLIATQKNINGFELNPELFHSEYLIVNFWASWCPPCVEETPSLIDFTKQHPEFKLVAISQDESLKDIQDFIKLFPNFKNAGIDVVFDQSRAIARKFDVVKLPETFVFSAKRTKYIKISGATNWADPKMLDSLLAEFNK